MADIPSAEDRPTGSANMPPPKVNINGPDEEEDTEEKETTEEESEDMDPATKREALHYWGKLFDSEGRCTDLLDRLLIATAKYISANFDPNDHSDLTPSQLALFYRSVGGNYDGLFVQQPHRAIAFVYQNLRCLHSLQPRPQDFEGREAPSVPALKPRGFAAWERIQLLLDPQVHVPYIQRALKKFDIVDPDTGDNFPKVLPKEAFPSEPDSGMIKWYEGSLERLKPGTAGESESGSEYLRPIYGPRFRRDGSGYFAQGGQSPQGQRQGPPPPPPGAYRGDGISRPYASKTNPRTPVEILQNQGRAVVSRVRGLWSPKGSDRERDRMDDERTGRRRSWHGIDETYEESRSRERRQMERERERRYRESQRERTPTSPYRRPATAQYAEAPRPPPGRRAGSSPGGEGQKTRPRRRPSPASPLSSSSEHSSEEEENPPLPVRVRPRYAPRHDRDVDRDRAREGDLRNGPGKSSPVSESAAAAAAAAAVTGAAVAGSASPIYRRTSRDEGPYREHGRAGTSPTSASPRRDYFPSPSARSHSHLSQLSGGMGRRHSSAHQGTSHHTSSQSYATNPASGSNLSAPSAGARRNNSVTAGMTPSGSPHEGVGFNPSTEATFAAKMAGIRNGAGESEGGGSGSSAGRKKNEMDERKREAYERRQDRIFEAYDDEDDGYRYRDRRRDRERDPRSRSIEDPRDRRIPFKDEGSSSRSRRGERDRDGDRDRDRDREQGEREQRRREYERERDRDYDRDMRERRLRERERERERERRHRYTETGVDGRRYPAS